MSSTIRSSAAASLALGVGIALGLALPIVIQRTRAFLNDASDNDNRKTTNDGKTGFDADAAKNAARVGLEDANQSTVRLPRAALDAFMTQIFASVGCPVASAQLVANVLSHADTRGIPSHGSNRADTYVNEIRASLVNPQAVPAVEQRSGCCAVVNGNNGLGAVTAKLAMGAALEMCKQYGVAVVTCHSSNHYGAAEYWAQMALEQSYIGMSFTNTSPICVPTRSSVRALGTNPFCFFAPGVDPESSFQLDMATTTVPVGKIEVLDRIGKSVPPGWGVDRHGEDCDDPAEICKHGGLYPLGGAEETAGYKGYGLGVFVEILSSVMSNASIGPDVQPWTVAREGPLGYGH